MDIDCAVNWVVEGGGRGDDEETEEDGDAVPE